MKRSSKFALAAMVAAFAGACATEMAGPPQTLRGSDGADNDKLFAETVWLGKRPGSQDGYIRTYSTQPALIPHAVENFDEVSLTENQCLECHGPATHQKRKAPPIGPGHFLPGSTTEISQARYACVMCHVAQADAKPLVENTFQGDRVVPAASAR